MADNLLKRLFNAATNKSHTYTMYGGKQTVLKLLSGYMGVNYEKKKNFVEAYGSNPLVFMIIKRISATSASINRKAYDVRGEEITNSQILDLLNNPNPDQTGIEFDEQIKEYLSTTGNAFILYIGGVGGIGSELQILPSDRMEIECNSKTGQILKYRYTKVTGAIVEYEPEDILHIKESNIVNTYEIEEYKFGLSRLQAAWVVVKSSGEKFNAEASIFKNRGIAGILTNGSDVPMLSDEKKELNNEFKRHTGGSDKYNSIHVTNANLKYIQTGMSPTDLKLLEGIISSLRILCSIYGMPSILFNDNEKSTFNNYEQAVKTAYIDAYIPICNKVNNSLSNFLSEKLGVQEFIKVDLTSIEVLKSSTNEIAQALSGLDTKVQERIIENMTQNELRSIIPVLGDLAEGAEVVGSSQNNNSNEGEQA